MSAPEIRGLQKSFTRDEYTSPEIFASELETIFSKHWCYVGRADKLSHIGDRMVCNVGSESILIVRNRESQLRAYFNVCQHRGSQLCDESGSGYGAAITCPYHSWSYSLEGKLVGAIHHEKESFDRECISLQQVRVDEWQGGLFVCLNNDEVPLLKWLENMYSKPLDLDKFGMAGLKSVRTTVDEAQATVDKDRGDWGANLADGVNSISFKQNQGLTLIPGMDDKSLFGAYVYPNMLIDVSPDSVAVTTYIPRSPTHTTVITDYLFPADMAADSSLDLNAVIDFNDLVNHQDIAVSERVQRGAASKSFTQAFHTEMEKYAMQFVKQYRQDTQTH
jgi:glycine betaine catabolism A